MDDDQTQDAAAVCAEWLLGRDVAARRAREVLRLTSHSAYIFLSWRLEPITDAGIDALCDLMRAEIKVDLLQRWAADRDAAPAEGE